MNEIEDLDSIRIALRDRYELTRVLGRGGFSTVFLSRDVIADRDVAIKVLHTAGSTSGTAPRFQREIRRLGTLLHPNIPTLLDVGQVLGRPYLVSTYTSGETLRSRLRSNAQQPVDLVVRVASQVADALAYLHRQGVVHRDLKPENIFITDDDRVLVLDFGLAKVLLAATDAEPSLTADGGAIGTPHYMSPEQIGGDDQIDGRADLYALGCVMYEMLAGELPFQSASTQAIVRMHLTQPPRELSVFRPQVSNALKAIVLRLLAKSPADRYQDGEALHRELLALPDIGRAGRANVRRRLVRTTMLAGGIIGVASAALWIARLNDSSRAPPSTGVPRVVVLPFEDDTPDGRYSWLARGLTREVTDALGGIKELSVLSPESLGDEQLGLATHDSIGRLLRARVVLSGSLDHVDGRLRATIRVRDVGSLSPVGAPLRVFAHPDDVHELRGALVDSLILVLRARLGRHLTESRWRDYAPDPRAWQTVLRAAALRDSARELGGGGDYARAQIVFGVGDSLLLVAARENPRWVEPNIERGWLTRARGGRTSTI